MQNARLHHVGYVVANIEKEIQGFRASLEASWDGKIFHDPLQKARVTFLCTRPSDAQIELVEPAGESSPLIRFVKKGGGLHHLCYEVPDLEAALQQAVSRKAFIVREPQVAVAFDGRRIAWVMTSQRLLMEFLEGTKPL